MKQQVMSQESAQVNITKLEWSVKQQGNPATLCLHNEGQARGNDTVSTLTLI
jgi:hypothetical protein